MLGIFLFIRIFGHLMHTVCLFYYPLFIISLEYQCRYCTSMNLGVNCCSLLCRSQSSSFSTSTSQATTTSAAAANSLLDFEDLLGLNTYEASIPVPTSLKLKVKPSLVAQAFQRKWSQLAVASTLVRFSVFTDQGGT